MTSPLSRMFNSPLSSSIKIEPAYVSFSTFSDSDQPDQNQKSCLSDFEGCIGCGNIDKARQHLLAAKKFKADSKEVLLAEIRYCLFNQLFPLGLEFLEKYFISNPLDIGAWLIWIQLKVLTVTELNGKITAQELYNRLKQHFADQPKYLGSLIIYTDFTKPTLEKAKLMQIHHKQFPNSFCTLYAALAYPGSEELSGWQELFENFSKKAFRYPIELAPDALIGAFLKKKHKLLIDWIETRKEATQKNVSLQFLKLLVYLDQRDDNKFDECLAYIRTLITNNIMNGLLFVSCERARRAFEGYIKTLKGHPTLLTYKLGLVLVALHEYKFAFDVLKDCLRKYPDDTELLVSMGYLTAQIKTDESNCVRQVEDYFSRAIKTMDNKVFLDAFYKLMGDTYFCLNLYDKAESSYLASPSSTSSLANLYIKYCFYDKAIKLLIEAIALKPREAIFWRLLGECYYFDNKEKEALATFDEVLKFNPFLSTVWAIKASIYATENNKALALHYLDIAFELDPYEPNLLGIEGYIANQIGEFQRGYYALNNLKRYKPRNLTNFFDFIRIAINLKKFDEAKEELLREPNIEKDALRLSLLIIIHNHLNEIDELFSTLNSYIELDPQAQFANYERARRALIYLDSNRLIEAQNDLKIVVKSISDPKLHCLSNWVNTFLEIPYTLTMFISQVLSKIKDNKSFATRALMWEVLRLMPTSELSKQILNYPNSITLEYLENELLDPSPKNRTLLNNEPPSALREYVILQELFERTLTQESLHAALVSLYILVKLEEAKNKKSKNKEGHQINLEEIHEFTAEILTLQMNRTKLSELEITQPADIPLTKLYEFICRTGGSALLDEILTNNPTPSPSVLKVKSSSDAVNV